MSTFEEIGRKLDGELKRLRDVAERKIGPKTRMSAAKSLRKASEALARAARDLESTAESKMED